MGFDGAAVVAEVGGGVENFFAIGQEVAAGGATEAVADAGRLVGRVGGGAVDIHEEDLVAGEAPGFVVALEGELFAVGAEVGFGVIAAVGELAEVFEVFFLGVGEGACAGEEGKEECFCNLHEAAKVRRGGGTANRINQHFMLIPIRRAGMR